MQQRHLEHCQWKISCHATDKLSEEVTDFTETTQTCIFNASLANFSSLSALLVSSNVRSSR
jgi:hypothetical protein